MPKANDLARAFGVQRGCAGFSLLSLVNFEELLPLLPSREEREKIKSRRKIKS